MVELLSTKLFVPPLRPSLIPRFRLVQLSNSRLSTKCKLTLVSAPAGFGKTTLVFAWLIDLLILALDDCHLLTRAANLEVMEYLLHNQPSQLHLVLATCEDPTCLTMANQLQSSVQTVECSKAGLFV